MASGVKDSSAQVHRESLDCGLLPKIPASVASAGVAVSVWLHAAGRKDMLLFLFVSVALY